MDVCVNDAGARDLQIRCKLQRPYLSLSLAPSPSFPSETKRESESESEGERVGRVRKRDDAIVGESFFFFSIAFDAPKILAISGVIVEFVVRYH